MELIIKIFAIAILSMIAIGTVLYLATIIVEAVRHASFRFPSGGKSELHCRDRYEVAEKFKSR